MRKKIIVVHSGGMDSSLCLALAIQEFGKEDVLSLSFSYNQRHTSELQQAKKICQDWQVDHFVLNLDCLQGITTNALMDSSIPIKQKKGEPPNTLVMGRNGLMAKLAGIHAHHLGAKSISLGIIDVDGSTSGYRDCSRHYMDLIQAALRLDLDDSTFEVRTPVVNMSKKQTLELASRLGNLSYLLENTITCYEGIAKIGCELCPSCLLRNEGIRQFVVEYPKVSLPYSV